MNSKQNPQEKKKFRRETKIRTNGLENIRNKKIRIFKFDDQTKMKDCIYTPDYGKGTILVMGESLKKSLSISFDGSAKLKARIRGQRDSYLKYALHALVKN